MIDEKGEPKHDKEEALEAAQETHAEEMPKVELPPRKRMMPEGYVYRSPFSPSVNRKNADGIVAPTVSLNAVDAKSIVDAIKSDDKLTGDEKSAVGESLKSFVLGLFSSRYDSITSDDKNLVQYLMHDGRQLANTFLSEEIAQGVTKLTGDAALRRVNAMIGAGRTVTWRLWHSGFTVNIGNFSPAELFQFQTQLIYTLEEIGTRTRGQILSADDAHIVIKETDFVIDHILDCTLKNWTKDMIRDNLDLRDIFPLLTGGLAALYPEGYPFLRNCAFVNAESMRCDWNSYRDLTNNENQVNLDFRFAVHVDSDKFTNMQKRIMGMPMQSVELKDLANYRDDFPMLAKRTVAINETGGVQYQLVLKPPMYSRYRNETMRFLSEVILGVDTVLSEAPDIGQTNALMRRREALSNFVHRVSAQRHSSWIEDIIEVEGDKEVSFGGSKVDERDNLFKLLATFSMKTDTCDNIISYVEDFKKESMYTFIGIPDYSCPNCKNPQPDAGKERPGIIPVSITEYFFTIMVSEQGRKN